MKVSVVMPTLNRAHILREAIDSVLSQSYAEIELIVVDGLSSDGTLVVLRSYGDRIRWISERDLGTSDAMNKGLALSTGDIITFLNSDDYFKDAHVVERAVRALPPGGILCADLEVAEENSRRVLWRLPSAPDKLLWGMTLHLPGCFLRGSFLIRGDLILPIQPRMTMNS